MIREEAGQHTHLGTRKGRAERRSKILPLQPIAGLEDRAVSRLLWQASAARAPRRPANLSQIQDILRKVFRNAPRLANEESGDCTGTTVTDTVAGPTRRCLLLLVVCRILSARTVL